MDDEWSFRRAKAENSQAGALAFGFLFGICGERRLPFLSFPQSKVASASWPFSA